MIVLDIREQNCPVLTKKLSTLTIDDVKRFIDTTINRKDDLNKYKSFKKDFESLYSILKDKKESDIHNIKIKLDHYDNVL